MDGSLLLWWHRQTTQAGLLSRQANDPFPRQKVRRGGTVNDRRLVLFGVQCGGEHDFIR